METLSQIHFTAPYWELLLPCIGAGADIITGWLQATINGTWDSTKMKKGLYSKFGEIVVVVFVWMIDVGTDERLGQQEEAVDNLTMSISEAEALLNIARGEGGS